MKYGRKKSKMFVTRATKGEENVSVEETIFEEK